MPVPGPRPPRATAPDSAAAAAILLSLIVLSLANSSVPTHTQCDDKPDGIRIMPAPNTFGCRSATREFAHWLPAVSAWRPGRASLQCQHPAVHPHPVPLATGALLAIASLLSAPNAIAASCPDVQVVYPGVPTPRRRWTPSTRVRQRAQHTDPGPLPGRVRRELPGEPGSRRLGVPRPGDPGVRAEPGGGLPGHPYVDTGLVSQGALYAASRLLSATG